MSHNPAHVPEPPPGFTLDAPPDEAPPPPEGFALDTAPDAPPPMVADAPDPQAEDIGAVEDEPGFFDALGKLAKVQANLLTGGAAGALMGESLGEQIGGLKGAREAERDFVTGAGEGASFGFGGEMEGVGGRARDIYERLTGQGRERAAGRGIDAPIMTGPSAREQTAEELEDVNRQRLREARTRSPIAAYAGEMGGAALASAAPGGLMAKGMRAAGAAAPVISQLAGKAPRLARMGRAGAMGAPIGAVEAAGKTEAEFGTQEFGEDVATGTAIGLLAPAAIEGGVAAGKAAYGAGKGLYQAGKRKIGKLAGEMVEEGKLGIGVGDPKVRKERLLQQSEALSSLSEKGKSARLQAARGKSSASMEAHTADIETDLAEMLTLKDGIVDRNDIASKGKQITEYMQTEGMDPEDILLDADSHYYELRDAFDELVDHEGKYGVNSSTLKFIKTRGFDQYERLIDMPDVISPEAAARRFMELDQLKRVIQDTIDSRHLKGYASKVLKKEIEPLSREFLERADVWGSGPASMQEIRNLAWHKHLLTAKGKAINPDRMWLSDASGEALAEDQFRTKLVPRQKGLKNLVNDALDNPQEIEVFNRYIQTQADLLDKLTMHGQATQADRDGARRALDLAAKIKRRIHKRIKEAQAAVDLDEIVRTEGAAVTAGDSLALKAAKKSPTGRAASAIADLVTPTPLKQGPGQQALQLQKLEAAGTPFAEGQIGQIAKQRKTTQGLIDLGAAPADPFVPKPPGAARQAAPAPVAKLLAGIPGYSPRGAVATQLQPVTAEQQDNGRMGPMLARARKGKKGRKRKGDTIGDLAAPVVKAAKQDRTAGAAAHYVASSKSRKYREGVDYNRKGDE